MKKIIFLFLILICTLPVISQSLNNGFKISHPINPAKYFNPQAKKYIPFQDTVNIVAIMVQFQEDNTSLSTGNGKFDLSNKYYDAALQRDTVIDSPPYDSTYFMAHLQFLKNYYFKSSKGKLIVNYKLYNNIITLPKKMQDYSPQKNESNIKLGEMFKDSWAAADSFITFSNLNPDKTAFVIFHAGVGRDIDLSSIFGFDPTPYDIPSLYLGLNTLKDLYGQQYNGYQTNEGFIIKNSLVIPSAELRELELTGQNFLLQLGMNGILVGSLGSYLGLPDLFNTANGKTAIGRFGLMDGQSLFSYNGIFPPEPSAWEKIYLGWVDPVNITNGDKYYSVKSSSTPEFKDSTVFKVFINSKEYFLLENRNRDPLHTGQKIYTKNRGFIDSLLFTKDVEGFVNFDIYKVNGNLIDVSYLDWSLPGSITDTSDFRGGILIWHIDENVISQNISSNTINNNIEHRGVSLKEAKGSQDIGVTFNSPFGSITGDGSFVDFWYNGYHYVPSSIYKNQFTPTSFPNSLSYSFANNNIYITEFDTISYEMKFRVKIGSDVLSPIAGYPKYINKVLLTEAEVIPIDITGDGKDELFVNNGLDAFAFANNGSGLINSNGLFINEWGMHPLSYSYVPYRNGYRFILTGTNRLGLFEFNGSSLVMDTVINFSNNISASPLVIDSNYVYIGFENGTVYRKNLTNNTGSVYDDVVKNRITRFSLTKNNNVKYVSYPFLNIINGNFTNINSDDSLVVTGNDLFLNNTKINNAYDTDYGNLIAADINKDGKQEIIFTNKNNIYAINSNGVLLDNFSFKSQYAITSGISIADINDDGVFDIIFIDSVGDLRAYGINGKLVDGFPYKIGNVQGNTPALYNYNDTLAIAVLSNDGYLYSVKTNQRYKSQNVIWKNHLRNKNLVNNNYLSIKTNNVYSERLPKDKVYNWPNPVYDNKTYIRYYLNGNTSSVNIKILDLSGEMVTKLTGSTNSNSENEVIWNVGNMQSGIYYGVIEAVIDGSTETQVIKIAIVK